MKKIIIAIVLLQSILGFSQEKKLKDGIYTVTNSGVELSLMVQDNKLYLYIYPFNFSVGKDSVLNINTEKSEGFYLNYSKNNEVPNGKIRINISNSSTFTNEIYFGSENTNSTMEYKSFEEIKELQETNLGRTLVLDELNFDIDKVQKIELVSANKFDNKAIIASFTIPENENNITIHYTPKPDLRNITGTFNEEKNEITLLNDGKEPLTFKFSGDVKKEDFVKPTETTFQKSLSFLGKEIIGEEALVITTDTTATVEKVEQRFNFSFLKSKNFKDALKNISKTEDKFLVVSLDLKNKNRQSEFDEFLKNLESIYDDYGGLSESVYSFDYYLATEKDKNLLSKNKIEPDSKVLIFNSSGDLLYATSEQVNNLSSFFDKYNIRYNDFINADKKIKFDALFSKKALSNKVILGTLKNPFTIDYPEEVEQVETDNKTDLDDTKEELSIVRNDTISKIKFYTAINDEMTNAKKGFYQLKSTLKTVNEKWTKIVSDSEKSKKIDLDFVAIIKQELNNEGFSKKIFGKSSAKNIDFKMLNYIFDNYKALLQEEVKSQEKATDAVANTAVAATDEIGDAAKDAVRTTTYDVSLETALDNYFYRVAYQEYDKKQIDNIKIVFEYYKKYVLLTDYDSKVLRSYRSALENNLDNPTLQIEYFESFERYFNKIIIPNKSTIENLDVEFSSKSTEDYTDWTSFKDTFANDCNKTAWEIVKKSTDKLLIQKAIKWSETSNELDKKNHYYSDTLARLYYLNGQKDKAIITQQKAVDLGKDSENISEYKMVLDQMKKGTYIYAEPKE